MNFEIDSHRRGETSFSCRSGTPRSPSGEPLQEASRGTPSTASGNPESTGAGLLQTGQRLLRCVAQALAGGQADIFARPQQTEQFTSTALGSAGWTRARALS